MAAPFLDLAEALIGQTHPCLAPPPRPSNPGMPAGIRGGGALRGWAEDAGLAPSPPSCSAPAPMGGRSGQREWWWAGRWWRPVALR